MFAIELNLSGPELLGIIVLSFLCGFMIRRKQVRSFKKRNVELEKEMLSNHADILDLQKYKAIVERNVQSSKIPVIPLKPAKEDNPDKLSDKTQRK